MKYKRRELDHLLQQFVDLVLTAAEITTFDEVVDLLPPPAGGGVQLEGPQEVGRVLEVGTDGENLMDKILHTDDAKLAKSSLDQVVRGDGSAVAIDLDETTLVHQFAHRLEVGSSPGDVRLTDAEHVDGSLVQLDEHAVVDLPQTEQLQNLLHLGGHLVDTANAHDESKLGVSRNIVVALLTSLTPQPDLIPLLILILLGELLSPLKDLGALGLACDLRFNGLLSPPC